MEWIGALLSLLAFAGSSASPRLELAPPTEGLDFEACRKAIRRPPFASSLPALRAEL